MIDTADDPAAFLKCDPENVLHRVVWPLRVADRSEGLLDQVTRAGLRYDSDPLFLGHIRSDPGRPVPLIVFAIPAHFPDWPKPKRRRPIDVGMETVPSNL